MWKLLVLAGVVTVTVSSTAPSWAKEIPLLPQAAEVTTADGAYVLPQGIVLEASERGAAVARTTIEHVALESLKQRIRVESQPREGWHLVSGSGPLPPPPQGDEAYSLTVSADGIALVASSEAGFRHGVRTLVQLLSSGDSIPACRIEDRPALALRGLMIDMIRLKERDEVYFGLLEEIAAWKMNALFLHFTDKGGCSIELKSHPEVVTVHPMSQETLRRLIARGTELGVRVIPELEAWGHAGWLTRPHPHVSEGGSTSLCLSSKDTYSLLNDVIGGVAGLFPDPYFHIGWDEAHYAKCDACKAKAAEIGIDRMIAEHINRVNAIAREHGKTSVIWADVVLRHRGVLARLDRDIILEDWDYGSTVTADNLHTLKEAGFSTLAAPALMYGGCRVCPADANLENVSRFSGHAEAEGADGVTVQPEDVAVLRIRTR